MICRGCFWFIMEKDLRKRRKNVILALMNDPKYVPMKIKELCIILQVDKADRLEFESILEELICEGHVEVSKRGKYSLATLREYEGVFTSHADGYGFVTVEGREEDLFIPEPEVHGALHGDTVKIKLIGGRLGKRQEATIVEVVERANIRVVGTFDSSGRGYGFVIPDNKRLTCDIFIPVEAVFDAEDGMKVVCEIKKYPDGKNNRNPEGVITEILGYEGDPGVDILSLIRAYDLPEQFPEGVALEARQVSGQDELVADGRVDLRDTVMVTIDGEDAKDLDDAVSLEVTDAGMYMLGVHIADVSHYVKEDSRLDKEAIKRGTSVYLADRVIPMLPVELSNGVCSLNQKEDRYALSCLMSIDKNGKVVDSQIVESIINVNRRMSYTEVNAILEGTASTELLKECDSLVSMFKQMGQLSAVLRKKRFEKGSIDFDFPETKLVFDEHGKVIQLKPYDRNVATKLIEEFMLIANRTVAETMFYLEMPFVYRNHESPDPAKIRELSHFINNFGYTLKAVQDEIHPKEIQKLMEGIEGTDEEGLISRITLRSMRKAKYEAQNAGHFGLAFDHYCHFTSPIRRYPDLQIHRIIKEWIHGELDERRVKHYEMILDEISRQSSRREIVAAEAERETIKLKKVEYMEGRLGECYDGVISGVMPWGIYVELANTIEGLVPVASLRDDYYHYVEQDYSMVGDITGRCYTIGQKVRVSVMSVNKAARTIDFELC